MTGSVRRMAAVLAALGLALATASCGSHGSGTASGSTRALQLNGGNTGQGATPAAGASAGGGAAANGGIPAGRSSGAGQGSPSGSALNSGGSSPGGSSATASQPGGPGTPDTVVVRPGSPGTSNPVPLGLYYAEGSNGNALGGLAGTVIGDGKAMGEAVVGYINAHGGFGGRKGSLVTYGEPVTDGRSTTDDQAACSMFTRDNHILAAVEDADATPTYYQCLGDRGVITVEPEVYIPDEATFTRYPNTLFSTGATPDRIGTTLAEVLATDGYLHDPGMKLGVLYQNFTWYQTEKDDFLKGIGAHGVKPAAVVGVCDSTGCSNTAELQSAVIKFRSAGVNHVVLLGIDIAFTFINVATGQAFYPRYGLSSQDGPELIALNQPPRALQGAIGFGWRPSYDVESGQDPPPNSATSLCMKIMQDSGQPPGSRIAMTQAVNACDSFFLLKAIFDRNPNADSRTVRGILEGLGASFVPSQTFATFFSPSRHDGTATYRALVYASSCKCFAYSGSPQRMPGTP